MRRKLDTFTILTVTGAMFLILLISLGAYIGAGIMLKADLPIVRNFIEPYRIPSVSYDAFLVADSWNPLFVYEPKDYVPRFSTRETEDEFFNRMIDVDRKSLYQLTRDFPELLENGWSFIYFDVSEWIGKSEELGKKIKEYTDALVIGIEGDEAKQMIIKEAALNDTQYRDLLFTSDVLSGAVVTKQGHPIYAMDGLRSLLLVYTEINKTPGYMALSYDKTKLTLSVTHKAHEGRWSTVCEHLEQNDGAIAAIPANDYTYNAKAGYGVVAGGFYDNNIPRYKMSNNVSLYMGFKRDGTFAVGEGARFGMNNFSEGQGALLIHGAIPEHVIVTDEEQAQILEQLASFIAASGVDTEADEFDSIPLIKEFIESFEDFQLQARYAWVIKENAQEEDKDTARLIKICDGLGADTYAEETTPVRCAFSAVGQRYSDGATILFGIGGAKKYDVRDVPENGATFEELQELFLLYDATNAAVTTSGDRVGFGWRGKSLLRVQDTTTEGGRTYGAYVLR